MKQSAFFVVVPGLLLAGLWGLRASGPSKEELAVEVVSQYVAEGTESRPDIDIAWQHWRLFTGSMDMILRELREGRIKLAEATDRLLAAADDWSPSYLVGVNCFEEGSNRSEKVARNIIRHFVSREGYGPGTTLVHTLEDDFEKMTGKRFDAGCEIH